MRLRGAQPPERGFWGSGSPQEVPKLRSHLAEPFSEAWLGRERALGEECRELPGDAPQSHLELRGDGGRIPAGDAPHPTGISARSPGAIPDPGSPGRAGSLHPAGVGYRKIPAKNPCPGQGGGRGCPPQQLSSAAWEEEEDGRGRGSFWGAAMTLRGCRSTFPAGGILWSGVLGHGWSCCGGLGGLGGVVGTQFSAQGPSS